MVRYVFSQYLIYSIFGILDIRRPLPRWPQGSSPLALVSILHTVGMRCAAQMIGRDIASALGMSVCRKYSLLEASTKHHVRPKLANTCFQSEKSIDLAQPKQLGFNPMKWILHRIGRLTTVSSQQYASRHEPLMPADPHQAGSVPNSQSRASSSHHTATTFDAKREEVGVENGLKNNQLVVFAEHGVTSIEDLAACATDDLDGWSESKDGKTIRHAGILDRLRISREDCEAIIINARIKAGWIT